jgi:ubiquinone/menaquinone biosynthesis C-methylase UbiE
MVRKKRSGEFNNMNYMISLQNTYNQIAELYKAIRDEMFLYPELKTFTDLLVGKEILDAGCGTGRDSWYFNQHGFSVTGVDFSDKPLSIAKDKSPEVRFANMNILALDFPENYFDGIWCNAVLSHLKKLDISKALTQFYRVLKPKGLFYGSVKLGKGEKVVRERIFNYHPRFTSFYSMDEFEYLLKKSGFSASSMYKINERQRFGLQYRDLDYIIAFSRKNWGLMTT